jgi:hypothetical protein
MSVYPDNKRFRVQKKFIAFFSIVPLLLATAVIQAKCPECAGSGFISSTGMQDVIVERLVYSTAINPIVGCNNYLAYSTNVNMTILNSGADDANGYITLVLQDFTLGTIIATQDVTVAVSASSEAEYVFDVVFKVYIENPPVTKVVAQVENSSVPCKSCDGKGTVALNSWPFVYTMRDTLKASQRIENPWQAPIWMEDYLDQ